MVLVKVTNVNSLKRVSTEAGCEKIQGMQQFTAEVVFQAQGLLRQGGKTAMHMYVHLPPPPPKFQQN